MKWTLFVKKKERIVSKLFIHFYLFDMISILIDRHLICRQ